MAAAGNLGQPERFAGPRRGHRPAHRGPGESRSRRGPGDNRTREIANYHKLVGALDLVRGNARLAVDDAGAGYAGLRHILELKPQFVKLDLSLVRHVDTDAARQAMVAGMAHFARNAGCELIAEGIETEDELNELVRLGVSLGQGYLFGKPGPIGLD